MECTWKVGDLVTPVCDFNDFAWAHIYPGPIILPEFGMVYHIRSIHVHLPDIATRKDCPCILLEEITNIGFIAPDRKMYELDWHWDSFRKVDKPDIRDLIKLQKVKDSDVEVLCDLEMDMCGND